MELFALLCLFVCFLYPFKLGIVANSTLAFSEGALDPNNPGGEGVFDPPTEFSSGLSSYYTPAETPSSSSVAIANSPTSFTPGTISYSSISTVSTQSSYYSIVTVIPRTQFSGFGDNYHKIEGGFLQFIPQFSSLRLFHDFIPVTSWDGLFYDGFEDHSSAVSFSSSIFVMVIAMFVFTL